MIQKKVLVISALFPPEILGGAEISAANLARWLADNGYGVGVLATASAASKVMNGEMVDGIQHWRIWTKRPYPLFSFVDAPSYKKPLWHLQDHFDPRNNAVVGDVIDSFKPDFVHIHIIQGIGYNALSEISVRDVPTIFFLHDLGLGCVRMSMFKNGRDCGTQCGVCKVSTMYKSLQLHKFKRVGLCSPSKSNLRRLEAIFPVADFPHVSILNANRYPQPTVTRSQHDEVHFLYVGRLHSTKGIQVLLEAAASLADHHDFHVTVVGAGPDEAMLRRRYARAEWCSFTGFISQNDISNLMVDADLLCVPSIWLENSPGVVIHALSLGLPVAGSDRGGIPELVKNGHNGVLVRDGDVENWRRALEQVLANPSRLGKWRANANADRSSFDQDSIARQLEDFMIKIAETRIH